ncbi:MAG: restriction endonuclease [Candidatus Aenigmarchaeota archaeon]|nr:restriction endonuclease [Candidatus Aenigmarchaeota archaeon]
MATSSTLPNGNLLFYGDNLTVLRERIPPGSVDLIYLDPPFNSNRGYNVLFKEPDTTESEAQVRAFKDYWKWDLAAERVYAELTGLGAEDKRGIPPRLVTLMEAMRTFLGKNDMMAYLVMMAIRLIELRRALKPTGALYLHCDPTASHYLKLLLDAVFGPERFTSEVIWKRTSAHSGAHRYGPVHDVLLFYARSDKYIWNPLYQPYDDEYINTFFEQRDPDGQKWKRGDLTGPGIRTGDSGLSWRGVDVTAKGRHWQPASYVYEKYKKITGDDLARYPLMKRLDRLDEIGLIHWPDKTGGMPRYKCYLEDMPGIPLQDIWTDINPLHNLSKERLHYQTQKPIALLERIIATSSNEGDVVLDPFCGCGTTIYASQRLKRRWIGIDITHLSISLIQRRLDTAFSGIKYEVKGEPTDEGSARKLAAAKPFEFQYWALSHIGAHPADDGPNPGKESKKGMDRGIDGIIRFRDDPRAKQSQRIIVSVKAGKNLSPVMVRELRGTIERENAPIGVLLTMYPPTKEMKREAALAGLWHSSTWKRDYPRIQIITVSEIFAKTNRVEYPGQDVTLLATQKDKRREENLGLPGIGAPVQVKKTRKVAAG